MKAYGLTICLQNDPEKIAAYTRYHQATWPEVLAGLREVGIREMRIFLRDRRMFMYVEADDAFDPKRDFQRAQAHPRAKEWNALMATLQERAPEATADEWWAPMDLVFDLNWPQHLP